jgi:ribosomal protein S18 acetylase RimI-like enzyme
MQAPLDSLDNDRCCYWYIENEEGEVIAALGVRENKYGSGGYEMDEDYVAVHKDYRNRGLAEKLLLEMEKFVKENQGRYIHVLTCDIQSYLPARKFYEKHGYKKVAEIPNYYVMGEGRIDYFKAL